MRSFRKLCLGLVCCLAAGTVCSQTEVSVGLEQAVQKGLENAYTLQAARRNEQIARNNNNFGEAGRYPVVSFNINSQNGYNNINNPTSFLNGAEVVSFNAVGTLDATWVVFEGFRVRINKNRLTLLQEQAGIDIRRLAENTVAQVTRAYWQAQVQQRRWQLLGELLAYSRDKMRFIETRSEYGQAMEFDRLQILDAYLNDSIQWEIQRTNCLIANQNLAAAMGLPPTERVVPADSLLLELPDYDWETLQEGLLSQNPQLEQLRLQERLAQTEVELRRSSLYPRISVSGGLSEQLTVSQINGKQPMIPNDWRSGTTFNGYFNLAFSYTIFNGGRLRRAVENAKLQTEIARFNVQDGERNLAHQLRALWERYNQQKQIFALSLQLNANAARNAAIAQERYVLGTLNFFDLRSIETGYLRSLNAMQDAFLNAKTTEVEMLQLAGSLVND